MRNLTLVALTLLSACTPASDSDTDPGSDLDTDAGSDMDTDAGSDLDTDADTEVRAACDDPLPGGPLTGDLETADGTVVGSVTITDRCGLSVTGLTFDAQNEAYPGFLLQTDAGASDFWLEFRAYENEDVELTAEPGQVANIPWSGDAVTVQLGDVLIGTVYAEVVLVE